VEYDDYLNRIHMIVEYTYDHFKDRITMDQLSQLTNRSPSRLSHFIKDALGISYQAFLLNIRFEYALKLLKETKLSIKEIVDRSGFSDHKYLSKLMKKKFNTTALQYRRSAHHHVPSIEFPKTAKGLCQELKACLNRLDQDPRFKHLFGMTI
jgi:AraC-like DNA-binding protein